ncbi:MAG: helix-turn-helix domain-containing protein [Sulfuricaulis sp.]
MASKKSAFDGISQSLREISAGRYKRHTVKVPGIQQIRTRTGMTQEDFSAALGISLRTLQNWEQRRRRPTGPAVTLLRIVYFHPDVLKPRLIRRAA